MCGIAGFYSPSRFGPVDGATLARDMATVLGHRGPDDSGVWVDSDAGIALAHRRLAVVDLSAAGHQPMLSASGRYVLAFNGEIYNHLELRAELDRQEWRGHSDTETLLASIEERGLEATVRSLVGMFAIVLWDRELRCLYLVRDRMGEKPLYYGWLGKDLAFGSELKSLRRHPGFVGEVAPEALSLFLRHGYIPAPYSVFQGIHKLVPGTILRISSDSNGSSLPAPSAYWSLLDCWNKGHAQPFEGRDDDAISTLEAHIARATCLQMVADVPLGAFLSGGIDSSTVVALMQAQSSQRIRTFTIGFRESAYNEADHARAVARHLGTEHTELIVTPEEAMAVIPQLPGMYDEPFADSSAIPTYLVSRLARQHVTVSLSGDGGDELFGGYTRYSSTTRRWSWLRPVPLPLREVIASGIRLTGLAGRMNPALPEALSAPDGIAFYGALTAQWPHPGPQISGPESPLKIQTSLSQTAVRGDYYERLMYVDSQTYLPDDVLCKLDRAAMSVSLESRVPLLDHRVVEFAWSLPLAMKYRHGQGKWLLRQVLERYVPKALVDRPKMGFGVPLDHWLRGPLREWAENLLDRRRLQSEGLLTPDPIRKRWQEHVSGQRNWRDPLWLVLIFEAWLAESRKT